ncbi:hypothetical protein ACI7BZ_19190 [Xanthobacter sp. AM11]|uniref:hypothetical protein n=1 Tax=Xanthobacter sp. AM11 TaxID=3380643 RepID=UPI0039BF50A9
MMRSVPLPSRSPALRALPRVLALCAVPLAMAVPAGAQALAPAEAAAPRYSFAPVDGGALKLDRETGRVSLCAKGSSGFTCEAVPDSRDAYEAEIARLQGEIDALRRAARQGRPLPPLPPQAQVPPQGQLPPVPPPGATPPVPDMSDIDRALSYAEQVYRRLKAFVDDLRAGNGQERL